MNSINGRLLSNVKNTFTYEFWVKPDNVHFIDKQSREVPASQNGKNYIIGPGHGRYGDEAGISVSVGLNGITIYEHTKNNIYAVLVHELIINEFIHISVVYSDKVPSLFVNGEFIKKGEPSRKKYVYPSGSIGDGPGMFFNGIINEIRIWDYSLTSQQLKKSMSRKLNGSENGLFAVWPLPVKPAFAPTEKIVKTQSSSTNQNQNPRKNENQALAPEKIVKKQNLSTIQNQNPSKNENQALAPTEKIVKTQSTSTIENQNPSKNENQDITPTEKIVKTQNSSTIQNQNPRKNENQDIEVSIIIPSFNKYPLNLFTLYSLEQQTYNPKKMEVIFINDSSTDQTEQSLKDYHPPFHFKYIRSTKNLGRSKVRNTGIKAAKGSILIFLDAEMMTKPDFVENHLKYHQSKENVIATGVMNSQAIYTCVFPNFNKKILDRIANLTNKRITQNDKEVTPLIDKSDIFNQSYKNLVYKTYPWFQQIIKNFGSDLKGFEFPWMAFLTGNVSIRKDLIEKAGCFDEEFVNYGYEDWELGYRLHKMGAAFIVAEDLGTYHQEHPVAEGKWKEAVGNYGLFTFKHYDVETLFLGLELALIVDLVEMSEILREYKHLVKTYPQGFKSFHHRFMAILETIYLFLHVDIRHINILGASGFGSEQIMELSKDISNIKQLKNYSHLTDLLEKIMNKSVKNAVER
jgi:GT2 family glycosyltransferase